MNHVSFLDGFEKFVCGPCSNKTSFHRIVLASFLLLIFRTCSTQSEKKFFGWSTFHLYRENRMVQSSGCFDFAFHKTKPLSIKKVRFFYPDRMTDRVLLVKLYRWIQTYKVDVSPPFTLTDLTIKIGNICSSSKKSVSRI